MYKRSASEQNLNPKRAYENRRVNETTGGNGKPGALGSLRPGEDDEREYR